MLIAKDMLPIGPNNTKSKWSTTLNGELDGGMEIALKLSIFLKRASFLILWKNRSCFFVFQANINPCPFKNSPDQNAQFSPYHKTGPEIRKINFKFNTENAYLKKMSTCSSQIPIHRKKMKILKKSRWPFLMVFTILRHPIRKSPNQKSKSARQLWVYWNLDTPISVKSISKISGRLPIATIYHP